MRLKQKLKFELGKKYETHFADPDSRQTSKVECKLIIF